MKLFLIFFKKNVKYLFIYLLESLIAYSKHPTSTLNPKSRLVNLMDISVFYSSLKMRVKVISVDMKNGIMNVVFVVISSFYIQLTKSTLCSKCTIE